MSRADRRWRGVAGDGRGQLVLLAAAAIAVAMVPLTLAYLGLGYHADVETASVEADDAGDAERVLERAVHNASAGVGGEYDWTEREQAVVALGDALDPAIQRVEQSRLESGVAYEVTRNQSAATAWADRECPSGPMRSFGDCVTLDGVVVQERAGETAALGVALDVRIVRERATTDLTLLVPAVG